MPTTPAPAAVAGLVGGIGPESTIDYYRGILAGAAARRPGADAPSIVIHSVSAARLIALAGSDHAGLAAYAVDALRVLADAGASFAAFASNTPHLVLDAIRRRSPLPIVSLVDAVRDAAAATGGRRFGLLGTRFVMAAPMYPRAFATAGMQVVAPADEDQQWIHRRYVEEMATGRFLPATRERLAEFVTAFARREALDAVVLAGTELPLLLREVSPAPAPLLDTAAIHVDAIVARLVGER